MSPFEKQYRQLLINTLDNGENHEVKNGCGRYTLPGGSINVDLTTDPFPILSGRHYPIREAIVDAIGFIKGISNSNWYKRKECGYWKNFGVNQTKHLRIIKPDDELVDEFCSYKGRYLPTDLQYIERYRTLKSISREEGRKLIDSFDISFYKEIVEMEKGNMGPTHAHLLRYWRKYNGDVHDQLKTVFDKLKDRTGPQQLTLITADPLRTEEFHKQYGHLLSLKKEIRFPYHLSHTYTTTKIHYKERLSLLLARHPEKEPFREQYARYVEESAEALLAEYDIPLYYLDLTWVQQNWDLMRGLPLSVASYAIMLSAMAKLQNMVPRYLSGSAMSTYLCKTHIVPANEMVQRYKNKQVPRCRPQLMIRDDNDITFIDQFSIDDFTLDNYQSLPALAFYHYDKR